jgi:hypothetical protein
MLVVSVLPSPLSAEVPPPNIADGWVATDAPGRKIAGHAEAGDQRVDKQVAMFFRNWHPSKFIDVEPVNVENILSRNPEAINDFDHPVWPQGGRHHWSEPLFGHPNRPLLKSLAHSSSVSRCKPRLDLAGALQTSKAARLPRSGASCVRADSSFNK